MLYLIHLTLWCVLPMALWVQAREPPQEKSPTLQDLDFNIDRIMEDERLFKEYYQCLMDLGPCTSDTSNFKDFVEEALERNCARCSSDQRQDAIQLLRLVMECRPYEYAEIERQYDPSGAFKNKYKMSLAARNQRVQMLERANSQELRR